MNWKKYEFASVLNGNFAACHVKPLPPRTIRPRPLNRKIIPARSTGRVLALTISDNVTLRDVNERRKRPNTVFMIPESDIMVESIVGIGYPDEIKSPVIKEELQHEKVFLDSYGKPYYQRQK